MKHFFKLKTWLIVLLIYAAAISLSILIVDRQKGAGLKIARAGIEHNVSGYAWSENFGWMSFNCANDNSCATVNYGVDIDLGTGNFSGYAWSSNIGWISFNRSDTGDPPGQPYKNGAILANYNNDNDQVDGWAKILSLGDDGWIKLKKFPADGEVDYGVSINPATGDFSGWAWNGNSAAGAGLGWLSFNCADSGDGGCAGHDYKVNGNINGPPQAISLTAPNWSYAQAGQFGALNAKLEWTFSDSDPGASQSAYQIIVNTSNSAVNPLFDSGECSGYNNPSVKCKVDNGASGTTNFPLNAADGLNYNTSYYWWVKVWDNYDLASGLKQYDTVPDTDNDDGNPLTFTTYKHKMPDVNFTWFPINPSRGEAVKFTDASRIYLTSAPDTAVNCTDALCDWSWSATAGATFKNNNTTTSTPIIIFNSAGNLTVTLRVTDNEGYFTNLTKILDLKQKLPSWKEVKPE